MVHTFFVNLKKLNVLKETLIYNEEKKYIRNLLKFSSSFIRPKIDLARLTNHLFMIFESFIYIFCLAEANKICSRLLR